MRIVFASTLAVLASAVAFTPVLSQPSGGLTDCGQRPALRYAAVFDASSSVRGDPAQRAETEASYRNLLGLLSGILCTDDRLAVYTFVADSTTRMDPLVEITPSSRTSSLLSATARRVIEARSGHTDLHLVTRGIVRDVIPRLAPDAIFVVTDGSYYRFQPTPGDQTLNGVRNRLDELAAFVADTLRPDSSELFVIGVNAANSYAIDRQLGAALPRNSDQRRWRNVDLLEDHGEDLLLAVFGPRYIGLTDLSLWNVVAGAPHSMWARRLDYVTHRDLPWSEVNTLSVQHLVYVPGGPGGSTSCTPPSADGVSARVEQTRFAVAGGVLCSLARPTPEQIAAIRESPSYYAFSQAVSLQRDNTAPIRGLHELLLRDSGSECKEESVRSRSSTGHLWRSPHTRRAGELHFSPASHIAWSKPMHLVRLGSTGCVVPDPAGGEPLPAPGEYLVKVVHEKTSVFRLTVKPARLQVVHALIRPGGLPFPSDRIALVRVCVRTSPALPAHKRMWMRLEDKLLPMTLERGRRCDDAAPDVAAFSGLVGLEHTDGGSAEVFVVNERDAPQSARDEERAEVTLKKDGRLFQSWGYLSLGFAGGMVLQILYACVTNRRFHADRLRRRATWSGAVISGIVVAVVVQLAVAVSETDLASDRIPVILALSVLAHVAKLLAAALVPEYVEEFLSPD
jgi:hypothetical protein